MQSVNSWYLKFSAIFFIYFSLLCFVTHTAIVAAQEKKDPWERPPKNQETELIEIIKQKQKKYVKESYGEAANQCFTDIDLKKFKKSDKIQIIIDELKNDKRFIAAVSALNNLPPDEQQELLDSAMSTYKPTWAELGEISRKGQTDAGQEAEKLIAEAVVNLIKKVMHKK